MRFAFISRHVPTDRQHELAAEEAVTLIHVGDKNAFEVAPAQIIEHSLGPFDGVVVVHPAAALRLASEFLVGVFRSEKRAPIGGVVSFEATEFHIYDLRKDHE